MHTISIYSNCSIGVYNDALDIISLTVIGILLFQSHISPWNIFWHIPLENSWLVNILLVFVSLYWVTRHAIGYRHFTSVITFIGWYFTTTTQNHKHALVMTNWYQQHHQANYTARAFKVKFVSRLEKYIHVYVKLRKYYIQILYFINQ